MKAMLLRRCAPIASRPLVATTSPDPQSGPGELLLRVKACAICRTDLHVIEGELPAPRLPLVPGHQIVGTVERQGPGSTRFRIGQRVGVAWLRHTCGSCAHCTTGRENLCTGSRYTGYHADGGFAELTTAPEAYCYAIPDSFDDAEAAPLLCAGIIGHRALSRSDLPRGGRLGLFGFGSSAHVVLQIAQHRGAEIFVCTRGAGHRGLARRMGASWVGSSEESPPVPLDSAIVFAPAGPVVPSALRAVGPGGTVVLAGITMTPVPEMEYEPHLFHEKSLRSVEANTRADGEALLIESAEIPIRPQVTLFPLEQANEALARLARDEIDGTGVLTLSAGR